MWRNKEFGDILIYNFQIIEPIFRFSIWVEYTAKITNTKIALAQRWCS